MWIYPHIVDCREIATSCTVVPRHSSTVSLSYIGTQEVNDRTTTLANPQIQSRSPRIEARATEDDARLIAHAAQLLNKTVSAFTVSAAVEKAENIVARAETTIMPAEQFDAMIAALDDPTPIPQIEALARGNVPC